MTTGSVLTCKSLNINYRGKAGCKYFKPSRFNELMTNRINNYFISFCSEFHQYNNDTDLGMKSSGGLRPPKLSSKEARSPEKGQQL